MAQSTNDRQTVTAYLTVRDAAKAIEFYQNAFGAVELFRLTEPGGKIGHAELAIGNSVVMLSDEYPDFGALSPQTIGGSPVKLHLSVPDADAAVETAIKAGATLVRPLVDEFYGERTAMVTDPFGLSWFIASPKETVSSEEMQRRCSASLTGTTDPTDPQNGHKRGSDRNRIQARDQAAESGWGPAFIIARSTQWSCLGIDPSRGRQTSASYPFAALGMSGAISSAGRRQSRTSRATSPLSLSRGWE